MSKRAAWFIALSVAALAGCSANTSGAPEAKPDSPSTVVTDAGARLYDGHCAACHQQDARGIAGVYPSLVGSPVLLGDPKELTLWVIKGRRPGWMPTGRYPTMMLAFGWMKSQDAAALFTYLRSNFGNAAAPVDAAAVAQALGQ